MDSKLIKSYENPRYKVELLEMNHSYTIKYENNKIHGVNYSEAIKDFKMASALFDMKLEELDGN